MCISINIHIYIYAPYIKINAHSCTYVLLKPLKGIIFIDQKNVLVATPHLFGSEQFELLRPFLEFLQIRFAVQLSLLPSCVKQLG